MPQVTATREVAGQKVLGVSPVMSWTALAASYHPSDVEVVVAGLTLVVTSGIRRFFMWMEFRAFIRIWRELARSGNDVQWLQYFGPTMAAFRYRGKAARDSSRIVPSNDEFSPGGESAGEPRR